MVKHCTRNELRILFRVCLFCNCLFLLFKYVFIDICSEWFTKWSNMKPFEDFRFRQPNKYITTNFCSRFPKSKGKDDEVRLK